MRDLYRLETYRYFLVVSMCTVDLDMHCIERSVQRASSMILLVLQIVCPGLVVGPRFSVLWWLKVVPLASLRVDTYRYMVGIGLFGCLGGVHARGINSTVDD